LPTIAEKNASLFPIQIRIKVGESSTALSIWLRGAPGTRNGVGNPSTVFVRRSAVSPGRVKIASASVWPGTARFVA
jgi:hypothetical protein